MPDTITPTERPNGLRLLARMALAVAAEELGHGEDPKLGNNRGEHVWRYTRKPGSSGAWCAAFVAYCYEVAADRHGVLLPFKRSHSARRLWQRVGAVGRFVDIPAPGDLVCWTRGETRLFLGHVGIVESFDNGRMDTIEGNRGPVPSLVSRYRYSLPIEENKGRLLGFARVW